MPWSSPLALAVEAVVFLILLFVLLHILGIAI